MANLHSGSENVNVATNLDQFPADLRILVVDDDVTELKIIEQMCAQCHYHVTTCTEAAAALNLLREKRDTFDVVISDVHMPGMDGYKFLQHVDQEFKVPVIMMSTDNSSSVVMEGIRHGACHYLIKPVHEDDIRNIWQHVVSKTWNQEHEVAGVTEYNDPNKMGNNDDDPEYTSSVIDANEGDRKKRSLSGESDAVDIGDDNPIPTKKLRFVWTPERHEQFVNAVIQLGDKAVPKRILELMNIPDMTRENVASHLQKFRLHLKKKSDETQQQNGMPNGTTESKLGASRRLNVQALAEAGHVSPQTQAGLHAEVTRYPASNIRPRESHSIPLVKPSMQEPNHSHVQAYAVSKYDSNIAKNFPQPFMAVDDASSGYGAWEWPPISNAIGSVGLNSGIGRVGGVQNGNNNVLMSIMKKRQMQEYHQGQQQLQLQQSLIHDPIYLHSMSNQPSYLVGPSQPYETLQVGIGPAHVMNYNYSFGRNSLIDHSTFSPQPNNLLSTIAELHGYTATPVSASPPILGSRTTQQLHNGAVRPFPGLPPVSDAPVPYGSGSIDSLHQGQVSNANHSDHIHTMEEQPKFKTSAEVDSRR